LYLAFGPGTFFLRVSLPPCFFLKRPPGSRSGYRRGWSAGYQPSQSGFWLLTWGRQKAWPTIFQV